MAGRRVLAGWVNGFTREGLGRVYFRGLAATRRIGRVGGSRQDGSKSGAGQVGNMTGRRVKFIF
jgi:hypothetical protein